MKPPMYTSHCTLFSIISLLFIVSKAHETQGIAKSRTLNISISAIFVFGDSTVDPGNNNYIGTLFKSNFPPYGQDFVNHIPTGRFTNGRLITDFLASYAGIKDYVPPYLDPTLSIQELMTGVSFASALSGYDPLTPQLAQVIPIQRQLEYFQEYKTRVEQSLGKKATEKLIKSAAFVVSAGTNDFVVNYFGPPVRRLQFSIPSYQQFLLQHTQQFIQGLWAQGARQIGVVGLPPMGCLPAVITLFANDPHQRSCVESLSSIARDYNRMLQNKMKSLQYSGAKITYIDIYKPLNDAIQRPSQFGFDKVDTGCCGTGLLEATFLCNPKSPVCPDASKYVFWDSIHPTQRTYYVVFEFILSNIQSFFLED